MPPAVLSFLALTAWPSLPPKPEIFTRLASFGGLRLTYSFAHQQKSRSAGQRGPEPAVSVCKLIQTRSASVSIVNNYLASLCACRRRCLILDVLIVGAVRLNTFAPACSRSDLRCQTSGANMTLTERRRAFSLVSVFQDTQNYRSRPDLKDICRLLTLRRSPVLLCRVVAFSTT